MNELFDESETLLKMALPKGSLQKATFELFQKAGFDLHVNERSYYPSINDEEVECILLRAQEIAKFVEEGVVDVGITGKDWIQEQSADVVEVLQMEYAKNGLRPVKWVLAVPKNSPIQSAKDLEGKHVATEAVNLTKKFFADKGVKNVTIDFSWGATEIKAPLLVDAIVDVTETGASLRANGLRVVDVLLESTPRLIVNKEAWKDAKKKRKIEEIAMLLNGAIVASRKVGLMMNVKKKDLSKVISILPALQNPTISDLADPNWCDVITIIDKDTVRELIPELKRAGASGIVEYPLNKIID